MAYLCLIQKLIRTGHLKTPEIIESFRCTDRKDFVHAALEMESFIDVPLPIGWEQTISQPLTVAFMLEKLAPRAGERILDVGSGSGWQAALLARIVGPRGRVYAVERIPDIRDFGEGNVRRCGLRNVEFFTCDGSKGLPEHAPYDRIIAAASAHVFPEAWRAQLKDGGRIIIPIGSSIWQFDKLSETEWREAEYPGFAFVPMIND